MKTVIRVCESCGAKVSSVGQRAVALLPVEKDAINGVAIIKYFAMIAAWVGDKELACKQLAVAIRPPSRLTYGQLRLLPFWDPLRGDPCFEKILATPRAEKELTAILRAFELNKHH